LDQEKLELLTRWSTQLTGPIMISANIQPHAQGSFTC